MRNNFDESSKTRKLELRSFETLHQDIEVELEVVHIPYHVWSWHEATYSMQALYFQITEKPNSIVSFCFDH